MTARNDREYGSPNSILWRYFSCLRRLVLESRGTIDPDLQRELAALAIFMAVSTVEAFLNIWFRTFSEAGPLAAHRDTIMSDLALRRGVTQKFKAWPAMSFDGGFPLDRSPASDFLALVEQRNELMHFTTNYDSVEVPGIRVQGLVDITAFTRLGPSDAADALRVSEDVIREFFRRQGLDAVAVLKQLHYWTCRVPTAAELEEARSRRT